MTPNNPRSSTFEIVEFIQNYCKQNAGIGKDELAKATAKKFDLAKQRSVFVGPSFSIRFSTANTNSFSNVVLSLSALSQYDDKPFIVCVVKPLGVDLLLANSTFLKKISHSSHQLTKVNVKGSFLGHDILRSFDGIANVPENFAVLFELHEKIGWELNLERLVEATAGIVPTGTQFVIGPQEQSNILKAPELALLISQNEEYKDIAHRLAETVRKSKDAILQAARIDNVNERGNKVEQIITEVGNFHGLEDIAYTLQIGATVLVDVKTKMLTLSSSPKGYNIDKILSSLAQGNTAFSFFFLGLDPDHGIVKTSLVSILDKTIVGCTRVQFHWAGRNSRGVTQLTGDLSIVFAPTFKETRLPIRRCIFFSACGIPAATSRKRCKSYMKPAKSIYT